MSIDVEVDFPGSCTIFERNPDARPDTRRTVELSSAGDNPVWICVSTEDGYQAWSSPIYIFN